MSMSPDNLTTLQEPHIPSLQLAPILTPARWATSRMGSVGSIRTLMPVRMKDNVRLPVPTVLKLEASGVSASASGEVPEPPSLASAPDVASASTASSGRPVASKVPSASYLGS